MVVPNEVRYAIDDLARLADVSRRTVRYYVQEGLIPAPLGVGRGRHYGPSHLERLLQVKALQSSGRSLGEIRGAALAREPKSDRPSRSVPQRSLWRRLQLAPGIELHVAGDLALPSPGVLGELADWCRLHFTSSSNE